jgi:hypothetical protein
MVIDYLPKTASGRRDANRFKLTEELNAFLSGDAPLQRWCGVPVWFGRYAISAGGGFAAQAEERARIYQPD